MKHQGLLLNSKNPRLEYGLACLFFFIGAFLIPANWSQSIIIMADPCVYISHLGNDTTGNGNWSLPYRTIQGALKNNDDEQGNLTLCLLAGNYSEQSEVLVNTAKLNALQLIGLGNVSITSLKLYPAQIPSGQKVEGFNLIFSQVTLSDQDIGSTNQTEAIFQKITFNSVKIGANQKSVNWMVLAKSIELVECQAVNVSSGSINLNNNGVMDGSVYISNLLWKNVTGLDIGFSIITSKLWLLDSAFLNSTSDNSLFQVSNVSNSLSVTISQIKFEYLQINDPSFFSISDSSSNITITNSQFTCNTYTGNDPAGIISTGLVLPFFDTNSQNLNLSSNSIRFCPIQCPIPTLALNTFDLFPCISCGVGNGSMNYICKPCLADTYSMGGICNPCPVYSNQPNSGQNHCNCFSKSLVDDTNMERCNNEVWGIIITGIYLLVFGAIIYFRRPGQYSGSQYAMIN